MAYRSGLWNQRKYNRRNFLKQLGVGAAGLGLLSACAPGGAPAAAPAAESSGAAMERTEWVTGNIPGDIAVDFSYTGWEGEAEMRKWLLHFDNFFSQNYPNVTVNGDWGVPWGEYWTKLPTQLAGGAPVDMAWMHDTRAKTFAANDWLLPLDDFLASFPAADWPDKFYTSQVEAFQYQGKQYGIPYDWAPGGFYINIDLFEEAGVDLPTEDWTFTDLLEAAKALTKDTDGDGQIDQWGINLPTSWSAGTYWVVRSFGGDFFNEEATESRLTEQGTIDAFQYIADLIWEHEVMPTSDMLGAVGMDAGLAFSNGLVAIHHDLNDAAFALAEVVGDKFRIGVAPVPTGDAGRFQFVGGSAFSIPVSSTQPEMAYELMRWTLTNPENLKVSGEMGSQFTGHVDYYEFGLPTPETGIDRDDFEYAMYTLGQRDGVAPNYHPKFLEWDTSIYAAQFDKLWVGEERSAAAVCQVADEQTNALLAG